jgi:hypothetical protein
MYMDSDNWPFSDVPSDAISIYDGPEAFLDEFAAAKPNSQVAFAVYWLQAEVLNGGLGQFFANDTGVLAPEAVAACRTLGLPQLAAKIEEAMTWFGLPYPRRREPRHAALQARRTRTGCGPVSWFWCELNAIFRSMWTPAPVVKADAVEPIRKRMRRRSEINRTYSEAAGFAFATFNSVS